ncbi:MAG: 1-deoxy-D-xylulose-5-phosphate synthase [Gammaproteobacteria bacterium]|nr:1-deoxy-D-xylulose-5-phosphate synthase [Gammaproteobacteria bacterium]
MTKPDTFPLLSRIDSPADLRALNDKQLPELADELRQFIIQSVSSTGGHFGANLGTVELSIALHYVFNTPNDRITWDVGHQAYAHKILTGRRERMNSMRKHGGLSPFPKRAESEYDAFGVGHSSTSISAAMGMALASQLRGEARQCIAVIGDGAMTAGMVFEALNHAGDVLPNVLIVLNDNEMSISPNVGALNKYLTRLLSGKIYSSVREGGKKVLETMPKGFAELARKAEEHVKGMVTPGTLFEELGVHYFGPVDGHDLPNLLKVLENLKELPGPRLLHIVTKKGKGYARAEEKPTVYHGVSVFDPELGLPAAQAGGSPTYTQVFSDWLCDMAAHDERLVGITPAMREGSGLVEFEQRFPTRYFDVGIAEQHAVTLAAGMACEGIKPVVAIYSTFLQRGYDQLVHDVVIQDLPVLFAIDRAGLVGQDGPTHAGSFDISFLRCLPNMLLMAPADENECRQMLSTGFLHKGPAAVRYPRGKGAGVAVTAGLEPLAIGKGEIRRHGQEVAILAFGALVQPSLETAEAFNATVVNMRFIKPLDKELLQQIASQHAYLVTTEENAIPGGAGAAISEALAELNIVLPVLHIGLPDSFTQHGSREEMLSAAGLDAAGLQQQIQTWLNKQSGWCEHHPAIATRTNLG